MPSLLYSRVTQLYTYIYSFFNIPFHYDLSQETEYSSLCYTVEPCSVSILNVIIVLHLCKAHLKCHFLLVPQTGKFTSLSNLVFLIRVFFSGEPSLLFHKACRWPSSPCTRIPHVSSSYKDKFHWTRGLPTFRTSFNLTEKTLMLGKIEGRKRKGRQGMRWLHRLNKLWEIWRTGKPGVLQSMASQRVRNNWGTEQQQLRYKLYLQVQTCWELGPQHMNFEGTGFS